MLAIVSSSAMAKWISLWMASQGENLSIATKPIAIGDAWKSENWSPKKIIERIRRARIVDRHSGKSLTTPKIILKKHFHIV